MSQHEEASVLTGEIEQIIQDNLDKEKQLEFIKADGESANFDRNYKRLIFDTFESVKFLNCIHVGLLKESLEIFRGDIFSHHARRQIPYKIAEYINREMEKEHELNIKYNEEPNQSQLLWVLPQNNKQEILLYSDTIYKCMQVILEYMDKGFKGMLTGDLNEFVMVSIQMAIEKFYDKLYTLSSQIDDMQEKI